MNNSNKDDTLEGDYFKAYFIQSCYLNMSDQTRVNMLYMFLGVSYKQMYTLRNWFNKIIIRDECLLMVAGIDYIKNLFKLVWTKWRINKTQ